MKYIISIQYNWNGGQNMEINKLFDLFSDEMRKWATEADWFDSN